MFSKLRSEPSSRHQEACHSQRSATGRYFHLPADLEVYFTGGFVSLHTVDRSLPKMTIGEVLQPVDVHG